MAKLTKLVYELLEDALEGTEKVEEVIRHQSSSILPNGRVLAENINKLETLHSTVEAILIQTNNYNGFQYIKISDCGFASKRFYLSKVGEELAKKYPVFPSKRYGVGYE